MTSPAQMSAELLAHRRRLYIMIAIVSVCFLVSGSMVLGYFATHQQWDAVRLRRRHRHRLRRPGLDDRPVPPVGTAQRHDRRSPPNCSAASPTFRAFRTVGQFQRQLGFILCLIGVVLLSYATYKIPGGPRSPFGYTSLGVIAVGWGASHLFHGRPDALCPRPSLRARELMVGILERQDRICTNCTACRKRRLEGSEDRGC